MKIQIESRNGALLALSEAESLRLALEVAVRSDANLRGANLGGADLGYARVVQIGPLGSRRDYLIAVQTAAGQVAYRAGCWTGTEAALRERVTAPSAGHPIMSEAPGVAAPSSSSEAPAVLGVSPWSPPLATEIRADLLAAIDQARGRQKRPIPDWAWAAFCREWCGTTDLRAADLAALGDFRGALNLLELRDPATVERFNAAAKRARAAEKTA